MAVDKKQREEQELERYGVWVKAGPDEIDARDGGSLDLMDIEDSGSDQLLITEEEEKLLGELEESSLPDFGDFDEAFDDSFEDFSNDDFEVSDLGPSPTDSSSINADESTELLHKIEGELNALREEIRQLKDELTGLRVPAMPSGETAEHGGFFDEEDDETIALTGDELDNILDSADMTEKVAEDVSKKEEAAFEEADVGEDITVEEEEEEIIDLSADEEDIGIDDLDDFDEIVFEEEEEEEDPALSILGSPDSPLEEPDSDTIEIDIPGLDETIDTEEAEMGDIAAEPDDQEEDVVSIDDITDDFEEITDLEDFGLDGSSVPVDIPLTDESEELILEEPSRKMVITESLDDEAFDEGEEVEIDLNVEDTIDITAEEEEIDVEMEEISLDDFGLEEDAGDAGTAVVAGAAADVAEESDVLAIDEEEEAIEEIDLTDSEEPDLGSDIEPFEDVEFKNLLMDGLEEEELEEKYEPAADGIDIEEMTVDIEDIDLEEETDLEIEEIDLSEETDIGEEISEFPPVRQEGPTEIGIEGISLEEAPAPEAEEVDEVELEEIEALEPEEDDEDIPEIDIDEAIEDIETVEEFSLEDDEVERNSEEIEEFEVELGEGTDLDESEMRVAVPDDDFNELPGTEEVDLDSLEALAAAPDLTEETDEAFISMPESIPVGLDEDDGFDDLEILEEQDMSLEIEGEESGSALDIDEDFGGTDDSEAGEDIPLEQTMERGKAALEISALPEDLKEQIKEVLKYMDQLLESLPDDKIQEFARSEHFEVYKKIFEELGISD